LDFFNGFEISIKLTAHIDRLDEFLRSFFDSFANFEAERAKDVF
jgi:hypothetical protein